MTSRPPTAATSKVLRLVQGAAACAVLIASALVATQAPAVAADKANDPVIFVPGYGGALAPGACAGSDVRAYFKSLPDTIASYGWNRANFRFVGYYQCDTNLTSGPHGYDWLNRYNEAGTNWERGGWWDSSSCEIQTASGKHANEDCDINNLAYHLAWFIYWNFSVHGQAVHVVAHSMGGLMIRSALFERPRQAVFPPTLLVENVVTFASPYLGANLTAFSTQQGLEMRGGSDYLNSLNTVGRPQGNGGTTWLAIGSNNDTIVGPASATNICCSGMHKVVYEKVIVGHNQLSSAPNHNDYMDSTWGTRTAPTRYVCWGTNAYPNATQNADNVGPMIERGLSGVWQDWPTNASGWGC